MITETVLAAFLATCGLSSNDSPEELSPDQGDPVNPNDPLQIEPPPEPDYVFCCNSVDTKAETGDGCVRISDTQIDHCNNVLACGAKFVKEDGVISCS